MTSIREFESYLKQQVERSFYEIEVNIKRLSPSKPEIFYDLKVSISHTMNEIYFEMLDFITWLEQENKAVKSRNITVLIDDLRKDCDKLRDFQAYISSLSATGPAFKNKNLFQVVQQNLIQRIKYLKTELEQYIEELKVLEQELSNTSAIIKRVDDYILQSPEMIGKLKQKINAVNIGNFFSQQENLASNLEYFSEKIEEQYQLLRNLQKVSALKRVLASLQLAKQHLGGLAKTVRKTDPKVWKQSTVSFEVFKKHFLEDLEGTLKIFAVAADDIKDAQKQLAA